MVAVPLTAHVKCHLYVKKGVKCGPGCRRSSSTAWHVLN